MPRTIPYRFPAREHAALFVRRDDRVVWKPIDAVVAISFSPSYSVTDHPVESGAAITDHIQAKPDTIVATVIVSENPLSGLGGRLRLQQALAWLKETADAKQLIDVVTRRLGTFQSYAITGFPHSIDNVSRLEFQVTLRKIKIATASVVFITVEEVTQTEATGGEATDDDLATEAGAPDEIDVGEQPTTDTTNAEAEEEDKSVLASLLDAL